MRSLTLLLLLCTLLSSSIFAQAERIEVTVHKKDGSTVEGMMFKNDYKPWLAQRSISVFDKSLKDEKKIKKKQMTKYKAKEIKAYESEGKYYEAKKVMIAGRGDHGGTLKALPKWALIERITEGPITIYMGYAYPPDVISGITFEEVYADLRQNPEYFMVKGEKGKIKTMHNANIEKWIADAPEVSKKFADGEFGNLKRKKKKKLGNFIKGQLENENPSLIIKVVEAYNEEMSR